jgi:ribonuclease P protein component
LNALRLKFGKNRRLLKRSEFDRVFNGGGVFYGVQTVIRKIPNELGTNRLGLVVKRKTAVERNRFKRIIREAFRQLDPETGGGFDLVAVAKTGVKPVFAAVREDIRRALGVGR